MMNMFADDEREGRGRGPRDDMRGPREGFGGGRGHGPGRHGAMGGGFAGFGGFAGGPQGDFMGGRGGRGPGRGRRGDVRNAILALLKDEPLNGYQIISAIQEKSEGLWRPGPGSVYPALNLLVDEGLVTTVDLDGKQAHTLSDAGQAYVAEHADDVDAPWERVAGPHKGFLDVRQELGQLGMAIQQVVHAGDPKQIEAAREILTKARKDLYRILAED